MDNCMRQATREELEAIRHKLEAERAKMAHPAELANAQAPGMRWQEVLQVCYRTAEKAGELTRMLNVSASVPPSGELLHADEDPTMADRIQAVMHEICHVQGNAQALLDACFKEVDRICGQLQRQD